MTTAAIERPRAHPHAPAFVIAGGFVAGGLDILYAIVFWAVKRAVPPQRILQAVAAGLLGPVSFQGGSASAALGLGLQFFIATTMSVTYFLVARRWSLLVRRAAWCGPAYGIILYGVMNYAVVPLSAAGQGSRDPLWVTLSVLVHMVLIGLPIALFSRRALATR